MKLYLATILSALLACYMSAATVVINPYRYSGGGGGGSITVTGAWSGATFAGSHAQTVSGTSGRALVVWCGVYSGGSNNNHSTHSVTDNIDGATGWVKVGGDNTHGIATGSLWYKLNIPSGVTTVTFAGGTGADGAQCVVHEVSNVTAFTGGEFAVSQYGITTNPQTSDVTNATATSVYFAAVMNFDSGNPATMTINQTGSDGTWVKHSSASELLDGGSYFPMNVVYQVVSSSAARSHGWTTASIGGYYGIIVLR